MEDNSIENFDRTPRHGDVKKYLILCFTVSYKSLLEYLRRKKQSCM